MTQISEYRGTVLVVDDDPDFLNILSLVLNECGFATVSCRTAQEALDRFRDACVEVVLSDIVMPGLSGIDLIERIHAQCPGTPVILMTGYADMDKVIEAIKHGAFDFIIKPYQPEYLAHAIGKAVRYTRLCEMEREYTVMLEKLNREMDTLVAERTLSLMALTMADKVRNPATVIGLTCRRMLGKHSVPEGLREGLTDIADQAERLHHIVDDFQALLKRQHSSFAYHDLMDVVRTVIPIIKKMADSLGIDVIVKLGDRPMLINMEPSLLRMAILHLLRNALDSTPRGGTVVIQSSERDDTICLTVSDSGPGIPKEDLERVFDPFQGGRDRRFGIGLPLVAQIVSEHLGKISVRSEPGSGTVICLEFPKRWRETTGNDNL